MRKAALDSFFPLFSHTRKNERKRERKERNRPDGLFSSLGQPLERLQAPRRGLADVCPELSTTECGGECGGGGGGSGGDDFFRRADFDDADGDADESPKRF